MSYVHRPPLEDMEPSAFISFLSRRQYVEAMESNHPGLESTTSWDLEKVAYPESQFPHLQKGYDNTDGHGTVARIKWLLSHSQSWLHLLPCRSPTIIETMPHYQLHHYQSHPPPGAAGRTPLKEGV